MKMQNTYSSTAHNQTTSAFITSNGSPFTHHSRKALVNPNGDTSPNNLAEALKLVSILKTDRLKLKHEVLALKQQAYKNAEKVTFYDEVADTGHLFDIDEAAKIVGTGRTRLLTYLRKHRVLMRSTHRLNRPYQKYLDAGQFEVKHLQYMNRNTGELKLKSMPFLTGKGLIWLQQFIAKHGRTGL
ncbi:MULTISPECIES: phage antirepressor KilAC domain-containing protein [unclassified Pseudomonas]|uniref:Phage antirepressor KilAC domain-containing protein n=1 Tax=Pseudomonas sp. MYb327 TaxID=2745230 RepID=A0AAU8DVU5_9PSED